MSDVQLPEFSSRRELRKAVVRLRMELHRQQLQHEALLLTQPLRRAKGITHSLQDSLNVSNAPLWGMAGMSLLSFLFGKRRGLASLFKLGTSLLPLLKLTRHKPSRPPVAPVSTYYPPKEPLRRRKEGPPFR
ncbi:hypothetical protein [Pseudomonas sp. RIT-PI-AD]|uniref:hypothetical protein n=1 Tax=Pseudomonas sp. RIT-PI-AD TaxID=3035294 RepID=UPI0021D80E08|nr:hypothetical protein [Pseudomonas sp. RIT-PI-AD]